MKVLTDINMNNNEIMEVIIHKVKSDPTVSAKNSGMIIFNTTDKKLKYCNGTEWVVVGSGGGSTITIDTSLSDSSTNANAAGSKAVVDYVKECTQNLSKIKNVTYSCPALSGSNYCTWNMTIENADILSVQVFNSNGEMCFPVISVGVGRITIKFNHVSSIAKGIYKAKITYSLNS